MTVTRVFRPPWAIKSDRYKESKRRIAEANTDRTYARLYKTKAWSTLRQQVLREQPICAADGCGRPASHVDHIVDHRGDIERFHDRDNLQGLCPSCHSRKTRLERGGWAASRGRGET